MMRTLLYSTVLTLITTSACHAKQRDVSPQETFFWIIIVLIIAGIGLFRAFAADKAAGDPTNLRYSHPEDLLTKTRLEGEGPWLVSVVRQSGNIERSETVIDRGQAVLKAIATLRRANIYTVEIHGSSSNGFSAYRTVHNHRGSNEGKKVGGVIVERVGSRHEPRRPTNSDATTSRPDSLIAYKQAYADPAMRTIPAAVNSESSTASSIPATVSDEAMQAFSALEQALVDLSEVAGPWDWSWSKTIHAIEENTDNHSVFLEEATVGVVQIENDPISAKALYLRGSLFRGRNEYIAPEIKIMPNRVEWSTPGTEVTTFDLRSLDVKAVGRRFIEYRKTTLETPVLGMVHEFRNANGQPDRRRKNNPLVPIVQYGKITLRLPGGRTAHFVTSSVDRAERFANAFSDLRTSMN